MSIQTQPKISLPQWIFHPVTVLACAGVATLAFVIVGARLPNFSGAGSFFLYAYHAPIGFAFVVYLFDRAEHWQLISVKQALVSLVVIVLALTRAVREMPFFSGHSLFATYMLLTTSSRLAKVVAAVVMVDIVIFKWMLHDPTLLGGIVLGMIAYLIQKYL